MHRITIVAVIVTLVAGTTGRAQIMSNPVQDYINKTQLLNNILSNRRAIDASQSRQTHGAAPGGAARPAGPPSAPAEPTTFKTAGGHLLPALLASKTGGDAARQREANQYFESLLGLYEQTARKDG